MRKQVRVSASKERYARDQMTSVLNALAQPKAFARLEGKVARVFAQPNGVTLSVAVAKAAALVELAACGAVAEERAPSGARFTITDAGRARMRRAAAQEDGFIAQHGEHEAIRLGSMDAGKLVRNAAESPLLWLYRRGGGLIGEAEFAAGERLRSDMTIARTLPRLTADLEQPSRSGIAVGLDPSEARIAAVQRVQSALRSIGPELSGVVMDVCGFLKSLETIERERGWPQRSAKLALSLGLAALARHYGLGNLAIGQVGRRRKHRWSAAGPQPEFVLPPEEAGVA